MSNQLVTTTMTDEMVRDEMNATDPQLRFSEIETVCEHVALCPKHEDAMRKLVHRFVGEFNAYDDHARDDWEISVTESHQGQ
jgi:hypothetical protein